MSLVRAFLWGSLFAVGGGASFGCASLLSLPSESSDVGQPPAIADASTTTDFYVDPAGQTGQFATIHDAVIAADQSIAPAKTIHVAAGKYTRDSGETFPIVLRDGLSIEGAGAASTIVSGTGLTDTARPSVFVADKVVATFLVGDPSKLSQVSGVDIVSDGPQSGAGYEAIVCDLGNADVADASPPNTIVSEVTIEGFDIGIQVAQTTYPHPSGCNLLLRASVIRNGAVGILAEGLASASGPSSLVSLQVGDGKPGGGNEFRAMKIPSGQPLAYNGNGVSVREAVTNVVIRGNHFVDSEIGIWSSAAADAHASRGFDIEDNEFGPLDNTGLNLSGQAVIEVLAGNSFHDISTQANSFMHWLGTGLIVDDANTASLRYPAIDLAHDNSFFGNDLGIDIRQTFPQSEGSVAIGSINFGTAAQGGNNVFRCNSRPDVGTGTGGDVRITVAQSSSARFSFAGNVWDHAPPSTSSGLEEGADLIFVSGLRLDLASPKAASDPPCPTGKVAGP